MRQVIVDAGNDGPRVVARTHLSVWRRAIGVRALKACRQTRPARSCHRGRTAPASRHVRSSEGRAADTGFGAVRASTTLTSTGGAAPEYRRHPQELSRLPMTIAQTCCRREELAGRLGSQPFPRRGRARISRDIGLAQTTMRSWLLPMRAQIIEIARAISESEGHHMDEPTAALRRSRRRASPNRR